MEIFLNHLKGPSVLVRVGQKNELREFTVPKGLLLEQGKWFAGALKEDAFVEGKSGVIYMPEDDPKAFEAFNYHLYNNCLVFEGCKYDDLTERAAEDLRTSAETWIFADKYGLYNVQDCAMHAVCGCLYSASRGKTILPWQCLEACFTKTNIDCPLRKLVADYVVLRMEASVSEAHDLLRGLSPLDGFIEAMYEAKTRFHEDDLGKLPRFEIPRQYKETLEAKSTESQDTRNEKWTTAWRDGIGTCEACGFGSDLMEMTCTRCALLGKKCGAPRCEKGHVCRPCIKS